MTCPRPQSELVVELSYGHLTSPIVFFLFRPTLSALENAVATARAKEKGEERKVRQSTDLRSKIFMQQTFVKLLCARHHARH